MGQFLRQAARGPSAIPHSGLGVRVPFYLKASGSGDEDRSLKSGPEQATGASLPPLCDADLRVLEDAARFLSSASWCWE